MKIFGPQGNSSGKCYVKILKKRNYSLSELPKIAMLPQKKHFGLLGIYTLLTSNFEFFNEKFKLDPNEHALHERLSLDSRENMNP